MSFQAWLALALGAVLGCRAAGPAEVPGAAAPSVASAVAADPAPDCPRAAQLEPSAIAREVVCLLQRYIQVDTTNPPGNELAAARFLQGVLEREGISVRIIEAEPGRANLMARLPGRRPGGALMLMHHMDVVPASPAEWSLPPLSAALKDGYVWGRGSLDNKGAGIAELVSLLLFKRLGVVPERDLVLLALADEESGGKAGARFLVEQHAELFADVEFILNEGGAVIELPGGARLYSVEVAQKAPLWLRVTARGASGHGGAPAANSAAAVLVRALARLEKHEFPLRVLPEVQAAFSARALSMPEPDRGLYRSLEASLQREEFRARFLGNPRDAALVHNTLAITMLEASSKENVVSERATAVLDVRLLPGEDPRAVTRQIAEVLAEPSLELEPILSWQAHRSGPPTALLRAIERLARARHPEASVALNVIGGFTDCNAFRGLGKACYGFLPMRIALEEFGRIHGKDERVEVSALSQMVVDLHALVTELGEGESSVPLSVTPGARP